MHLSTLKKHWTEFGKQDPLWAILTHGSKKGGKWDVDEFFELGRRDVDAWFGAALAAKPDLGRGTALDFGCGVGRLTQSLAEHFESVAGVDIAPTMIVEAAKYNRHGTDTFITSMTVRSSPVLRRRIRFHLHPDRSSAYGAALRERLPEGVSAGAEARQVVLFQLPEVSLTPDNIIPEDSGPIADMFGIPPIEVIEVIDNNGGRVLKGISAFTGRGEESHLYC